MDVGRGTTIAELQINEPGRKEGRKETEMVTVSGPQMGYKVEHTVHPKGILAGEASAGGAHCE